MLPSASLLVRRHRRPVAAGLAGGAVVLTLLALRAPAEPSAPAVLATRDLRPGQVLLATDLATAAVPTRLIPAGSLTDPEPVIGRRVASPIAAGEQLLDMRLEPPAGASPQVAPVILPLPVDGLGSVPVRAGDRVDVLGVPHEGLPRAQVLARDVLIAADPPLPGAGESGQAAVLIEVAESVALHLTGAARTMTLTIALRR